MRKITAITLRHFGHVLTMGQNRLSNIAEYDCVEGNTHVEMQRKPWLQNVTDDRYHHGWSIVEATHVTIDSQC